MSRTNMLALPLLKSLGCGGISCSKNGSGITLHVIVNWRFWIPDIPIMKGIGILKGSAGQCQNHPAPEQQFTIR